MTLNIFKNDSNGNLLIPLAITWASSKLLASTIPIVSSFLSLI
jgi:hypothetical protein